MREVGPEGQHIGGSGIAGGEGVVPSVAARGCDGGGGVGTGGSFRGAVSAAWWPCADFGRVGWRRVGEECPGAERVQCAEG